jgi:hypothetical protein
VGATRQNLRSGRLQLKTAGGRESAPGRQAVHRKGDSYSAFAPAKPSYANRGGARPNVVIENQLDRADEPIRTIRKKHRVTVKKNGSVV